MNEFEKMFRDKSFNAFFGEEAMSKFIEAERDSRDEKLKAIQIDCIKSVINDLYNLVTKHKDCDTVTRRMAMSMAADYLISTAELELDE